MTEKEKRMTDELQVVNQQIQQRDDFDDLPVQASKKAAARYHAIIGFCKDHLKYGTHYSVLPAEEWKCKDKQTERRKTTDEIMNDPTIKKFLTEPGADMLNMSWGVRESFTCMESITDFATPRFFYRYKCQLLSPSGRVLKEAEGSASSEEPGFITRWLTAEEIRSHPDLKNTNLDSVRSKEFGRGKWTKVKYAVRNPDLNDQMHNVNLRAQKRAKVKVTRALFGIGDLFNQPIDDWDAPEDMEPVAPEDQETEATPRQDRKAKARQAPPEASNTPKKVLDLQRMFQERCEANGLSEKSDQDEKLACMWGDTEIVNWRDITSPERGELVEEWINTNLPPQPGQKGMF